jgi:hypothetical protein
MRKEIGSTPSKQGNKTESIKFETHIHLDQHFHF